MLQNFSRIGLALAVLAVASGCSCRNCFSRRHNACVDRHEWDRSGCDHHQHHHSGGCDCGCHSYEAHQPTFPYPTGAQSACCDPCAGTTVPMAWPQSTGCSSCGTPSTIPYGAIPYESSVPTYSTEPFTAPSDYYTPGAEPTPAPVPEPESAYHLPPTSTAVQPTFYESPAHY